MIRDEELGHNAGTVMFTDRHGREWDLTITAYTVRRIEASDFSELWDGDVTLIRPDKEFLSELVTNSPLAIAVVWAICSAEAIEEDKTRDENWFLARIDGKASASAQDALWGALEDFFPQAKTVLSHLNSLRKQAEQQARTGLAKLEQRAMKRLGPQSSQGVEKLINEQLSKLEAELERELEDEKPGETSTQPLDASA